MNTKFYRLNMSERWGWAPGGWSDGEGWMWLNNARLVNSVLCRRSSMIDLWKLRGLVDLSELLTFTFLTFAIYGSTAYIHNLPSLMSILPAHCLILQHIPLPLLLATNRINQSAPSSGTLRSCLAVADWISCFYWVSCFDKWDKYSCFEKKIIP